MSNVEQLLTVCLAPETRLVVPAGNFVPGGPTYTILFTAHIFLDGWDIYIIFVFIGDIPPVRLHLGLAHLCRRRLPCLCCLVNIGDIVAVHIDELFIYIVQITLLTLFSPLFITCNQYAGIIFTVFFFPKDDNVVSNVS